MITNNVSSDFYSTAAKSQYSYSLNQNETPDDESKKTDVKNEKGKESDNNSKTGNQIELTESEQKEVEKLKKRDAEVKAHEMAHMAAGGQYAGVASFEYETGPNGVKYAVGGEVPIDVSEVPGDPQATITKMGVVKKAALAPASPSAADRSIAASASMKEMEARSEVMRSATETTKNAPENAVGQSEYSKDQPQANKGDVIDITV